MVGEGEGGEGRRARRRKGDGGGGESRGRWEVEGGWEGEVAERQQGEIEGDGG